MGSKVLIIGNGFDLAHGLPTSYADFLEFAERFQAIYIREETVTLEEVRKDYIESWKGNEHIKRALLELFLKRVLVPSEGDKDRTASCFQLGDDILDKMAENLQENIWFRYFCELHAENKIRGKNWIDFESEISTVIQWIDKKFPSLERFVREIGARASAERPFDEKMNWFWRVCLDLKVEQEETLEEFINRLYSDLERLTEALGTYLAMFVEKIHVEPIETIEAVEPDYVISFNYTHTYQNVYKKSMPVCYIHGECGVKEKEPCDMVIGIEQYLDMTERDSMTNMAIFKKFVQRIRKKNDRSYRDMHIAMKENYEFLNEHTPFVTDGEGNILERATIFVYGHSLDVTDSDVLSEILGAEYASLVIFAKGRQAEGKLISNLIKLIGEENLKNKAYKKPTMLEFRII